MRLMERVARYVFERILPARPADFIIGTAADPYMERWYLIPRNHLLNVYLHHIMRSDDDRALHDHPWPSASLCLNGALIEVRTRDRRRLIAVGTVVFRSPWCAHRLETLGDRRCWTLFITGPRVREWGFWCPNGWKHWKDFTKPRASGETGRGCE